MFTKLNLNNYRQKILFHPRLILTGNNRVYPNNIGEMAQPFRAHFKKRQMRKIIPQSMKSPPKNEPQLTPGPVNTPHLSKNYKTISSNICHDRDRGASRANGNHVRANRNHFQHNNQSLHTLWR